MDNENEQRTWRKKEQEDNFAYSIKKRSSKKQFIVAIGSSICIGIIFGIIILHMIKQEAQQEALLSHIDNGDAITDDSNDVKSGTELEPISMYVIQGGVFSEESNAKEWEDKLKNIQFPAMSWERDGQYYLFAGVSLSKETQKKWIDEMETAGVDVFGKEWQVPSTNIHLNEKDIKWVQSFLTLWTQSLQSIENQEGLLEESWKKLIEEANIETDQINALTEIIQQKILTDEMNNNLQEQIALLHLINYYEEIFVN